jgi:GNAT superfamily N-acetyltransferase
MKIGDSMKLSEFKQIDENIDLDKYIEFREDVKKSMLHPEWLGDFSKDDLIKLLDTGSKIWIYYDNDKPVCSMMLIPSDEKGLAKFNIDLDYHIVADYGPIFVNPKYQGNGLQYQMLLYLDNYIVEHGYKYAATTVHPDNIYCINNILKDGFEKKGYHEFSRGPRNIYLKEVN